MRKRVHASRRAARAGSVAALALTLPKGAFAQVRQSFPEMVKLSWGEGDGNPGMRCRLITAVAAAMARAGSDIHAARAFADA